jgi:hypothetical protein
MTVQYSAMVVLAAMLLVVVTGCSSKSSSTSGSGAPVTGGSVAASPATANLTGTWQGYAGVGARSTNVTLNLQQDGPALKGDIAVGGRPDLSGTVTGMVDGDTLRLRLESGAASPQLRVQGDTITGIISGEPLNARRVR